MKIQAIKDVKNSSVDIAIQALEKIIKNVKNFFGAIAVIDVHVSQPPLKAGRHQLTIFRAVAHVESHLGAVASSALSQRARDIVRARGHFGPSDDPVAVYQGRSVLRHGGLDCVESRVLGATGSDHRPILARFVRARTP